MSESQPMIDVMISAIDSASSAACVGIDPVFSKLPDELRLLPETEAIEQFCCAIIDACAGVVGVVKPQSACFERYGSAGYAILERTIAHARDAGLVVILDAKRGDIGSSAQHYAVGGANMGAHFITLSPYMGPSTIEPFLDEGLGVFALVRTSNPDSDRLQTPTLNAGKSVAEEVGSMLAEMGASRLGTSGLSDLGAVVGATKAADAQALRDLMPNQMFLVPGVGAQGGSIDDVRTLVRTNADSVGTLGVIVNASRSVNYAKPSEAQSWEDAIHEAALSFKADLQSLSA